MRLWHYKLIPFLPTQQLLGQHRECCALRGKGWGKPHSVVNYVFQHPYYRLFLYHIDVMNEMVARAYSVTTEWWIGYYRGKIVGMDHTEFTAVYTFHDYHYPEHTEEYLQECLDNLEEKRIYITNHELSQK